MNNQIAVLGCGRTGIQVVMYLLEQSHSNIIMFDSDVEYAKGMALDCMQASSVRGWNARVTVANSINVLANVAVLVITENRQETMESDWERLASAGPTCIFAGQLTGQDTTILQQGNEQDTKSTTVFAVHGIADAAVLARSAADILNIDPNDVQAMVYGGVGNEMQSAPHFVRASGIPIDDIVPNSFATAYEAAKKTLTWSQDTPWKQHYRLAAAAAETALLVQSGQNALLPVTTSKGTIPALVGAHGIIQWHDDIVTSHSTQGAV